MGWGSQVVNTQIRNNERLIYDAPALALDLWPRVEPFVAKETSAGVAIGLNDRFRFYKYFPDNSLSHTEMVFILGMKTNGVLILL